MDDIIIIYLIKVSVALTLFYLLYKLCFTGDTFLRLRRFFFLFAILFSLSFPFLTIQLSGESPTQLPTYWLSQIEVGTEVAVAPVKEPVSKAVVLLTFLSVVSLMLAFRFIKQLAGIILLKAKHEAYELGTCKIIRLVNKDTSPFSFFNWIFINTENNDAQIKEIITHEQVHARQYHSIDVVLAQILCVCFWWNPIVWLLKREMKINLEYLADQGVLDEGFDSRAYQYVLLQVSNKNTGIQLINNFNVSQLKKRITMMNKRKSSILISMKYLLAIPVGAILLLGNAVQASSGLVDEGANVLLDNAVQISSGLINESANVFASISPDTKQAPQKKQGVFDTVDQMPAFPGGEEAMQRFLVENLKYPAEAQAAGAEGRVTVRFIVKSNGEITDLSILKGIHPLCDKEAMRVVKSMPNWTPGKQKGKAVDVYYVLPIMFKLKGSNNTSGKVVPTDKDLVVVGYGAPNDAKTIPNLNGIENALYVIDGKIVYDSEVNALDTSKIESISVLKPESAAKVYGVKGKYDVIVIELKK